IHRPSSLARTAAQCELTGGRTCTVRPETGATTTLFD
ncbi:hypothetical protein PENANT_c360G02997, partial [Penicillium antarcticum]